MLKRLVIGRRLAVAFPLLLGLMLVVAAVGYWGLEVTASLGKRIIIVEATLVEHSQRARSATLGLRRFEKDLLLHIADPAKEAEYLEKWNEAKEAFAKVLSRVDVSSIAPADAVAAAEAPAAAAEEREG